MIKMTKFAISLTSSIPQKLVPGLNSSMGSYILVKITKVSNVLGKQTIGSLRRPFQLYMGPTIKNCWFAVLPAKIGPTKKILWPF